MLLNVFAGVALCVALIGLSGIVSFAVSERTQEIGIRMALGATRQDIQRLVASIGVKLAAIGLVIGLFGAMSLSRTLTGVLFEVHPFDPITYLAIVVILFATVSLPVGFRRSARRISVPPTPFTA